jgi:hypothetical protein
MWHSVRSKRFGLINVVNDVILGRQWRDPGCFPELRHDESLLAFSDYGGDHNASPYHGYAFLYVGSTSFPAWEQRRLQIRDKYSIRERTFAYKKLNDRRKMRALPDFLRAGGAIKGLCAVVLVDKRVDSLFRSKSNVGPCIGDELWPHAKFSLATFERLMRIIHFNAFFIAGLVGMGQNILWITDRDEIAANTVQLTALTDALGRCLSGLLLKDDGTLGLTLGHCRCGTTAFDVNLQLEDMAAIPDLAIGAIVDAMSAYVREDKRPRGSFIVPPPDSMPRKARQVLNWFSDDSMMLNRLVLLVEPGDETLFRIKILNFHGSKSLARRVFRLENGT